MKGSKTLRLLKVLSPDERAQFLRYLDNPHFCRKAKVRQMAAALVAQLSGHDGPLEESADPAEAEDRPEPKEKQSTNLLLHEIKTHLEDFLVLQHIQADKIEYQRQLIAAFSQRQASEFLVDAIQKLEKTMEPKAENTIYFKLMHELYVISFNHQPLTQQTKHPTSIQDVIGSLDHFWLNARLSHTWTAYLEAHHYKELDAATIAELMRPVLVFHASPAMQDNAFAQIYAIAIETAVQGQLTVENFERIHALAFGIMDHSESQERIGMMNLLINYLLIAKSNTKVDLLPRVIALYQKGLETGALLKDSYLTYGDFTNMVVIGCRAQRFTWVRELLDKYAQYLNPSIREAALKLALARLAFYQGEFRKSIIHLNQRGKFLHDNDKLSEKLLRIYCYFELDDLELLEDALEAFRKFLERSSFGDGLVTPLGVFIRLLRRMIQHPESETLDKIAEEAMELPNSAYAQWLREKVAQKLQAFRKGNVG